MFDKYRFKSRQAVVRPIIINAAIIWWPRVKLKTSQAELRKLQRMACLGITGAMRTAPTTAMEVLLGLLPFYICRWRQRPKQTMDKIQKPCNSEFSRNGFIHKELNYLGKQIPVIKLWPKPLTTALAYKIN
jgi:hypothetical protein